MKLDPKTVYTIAPLESGEPIKPEFIRLPKKRCPYTGLSRAKMNELVLPCKNNGHNPPVKSVCLRQKGKKTGVRLVHYQSLLDYLYGFMQGQKD